MSQPRRSSESFLAHDEARTYAPPQAPESGTFLRSESAPAPRPRSAGWYLRWFLAELGIIEATMVVVMKVGAS